MTQAPAPPDAERLARHRRLMSKLLKVHFLAYVPAFSASVAAIPYVVDRALADGSTRHEERAVMLVIMAGSIIAFVVAFVLAHALGVPWLRARDDRGRGLAIGGALAMTLACVVAGAVGWAALFSG